MSLDERRAELLGWIDNTKRLQRRMGRVFTALAIASVGLLFVNRTAGTFALIIVGVVAMASFWVTSAHNIAHRHKLAELDRNGGKPLQTAHRRWHSS
jgi:hypothetical protein